MRTSLLFLAIPVALGIALGMFVSQVYNESPGGVPVAGAGMQMQGAPDAGSALTASVLTAGGSPALGDAAAEVTMVEWGDYQCTYCYLFHNGTLQHIKDSYVDTGKVRLVFKDFALNGPDSALAAEASRCAAEQSRYWEYHDMLYRNWGGERTGWITMEVLDAFAESVGLDVQEFERCMESGRHRGAVAESYRAGQDIGIDATPSFMIFDDKNVVKIRGNQPQEVFVGAIEGLLQN